MSTFEIIVLFVFVGFVFGMVQVVKLFLRWRPRSPHAGADIDLMKAAMTRSWEQGQRGGRF
jgi:hypothetical protein